MNDFEKWKNWLDQWSVEYTIDECDTYRGEPTIELDISGSYAYTAIVFKADTKKFMYMTAQE